MIRTAVKLRTLMQKPWRNRSPINDCASFQQIKKLKEIIKNLMEETISKDDVEGTGGCRAIKIINAFGRL